MDIEGKPCIISLVALNQAAQRSRHIFAEWQCCKLESLDRGEVRKDLLRKTADCEALSME